MLEKAVIIKGIGGLYTVASGGKLYNCRARGIFRKDLKSPVTGDYVEITEIDVNKSSAIISKIYDRKNILIRPTVANVDQVVMVIAPVSPKPDMILVDKILVQAKYKGISTILVINKDDQDNKRAQELCEEYKSVVDYIFITCAHSGIGVNNLKEVMKNKISVMCGQSGVGKSSLLNILLNKEAMQTGELSEKNMSGKHTTRHSEMFLLSDSDSGYVIDSPGFSLYELDSIHPTELQNLYPEIYNLLNSSDKGCKFQDCSHTGELGCIINLEKGSFSKGRYIRYKEIYKELKQKQADKYR